MELCYHDTELLIDWYSLRQSLVPQGLARKVLCSWIDDLFHGITPTTTHMLHLDAMASGVGGSEAVWAYSNTSSRHAVTGRAAAGAVDSASARNSYRSNSMDNLSEFSFTPSPTPIKSRSKSEKRSSPTAQSPGGHVGHLQHLSQLQKNFTDSFLRFLPFCLGGSALEVIRQEEEEEREAKETRSAYSSPGATSVPPFSPTGEIPMTTFHRSVSDGDGRSVLQSANPGMRNFMSSSKTAKAGGGLSAQPPYQGLDEPLPKITEMLDFYYPSKLHQLFFLDLTSLLSEDAMLLDSSSDYPSKGRASGSGGADDGSGDPDQRLVTKRDFIRLPNPHTVRGIFFPPKTYSFLRIKRVVERMIDEGGADQYWSLAFRDDSFSPEGRVDFHSQLIQTLRRFCQIVSVSFSAAALLRSGGGRHVVCLATPEATAHLGHMAGNIPPSIRFMNLRGVLSSDSVQALCLNLLHNNAAFKPQLEPDEDLCQTDEFFGSELDDGDGQGSLSCRSTSTDGSSPMSPPERIHRHPLKGLLGLAITNTVFTADDIRYLLDLLTVYPNPHSSSLFTGKKYHSALGSGKSSGTGKDHALWQSMNAPNRSKNASVPTAAAAVSGYVDELGLRNPNVRALRGLRFLDVSSNSFGDATCADVLRAAACGPLEGLDMGGNRIHNGSVFVDVFTKTVACAPYSHLRHLGLSCNILGDKVLCSILDCLQRNSSLTSLDLSHNEWGPSTQGSLSLRAFLKTNVGMRRLDISHNRLTAETAQQIYLGMLENDNMLLLPMNHNSGAQHATELPFIQDKLSKNRSKYKVREILSI